QGRAVFQPAVFKLKVQRGGHLRVEGDFQVEAVIGRGQRDQSPLVYVEHGQVAGPPLQAEGGGVAVELGGFHAVSAFQQIFSPDILSVPVNQQSLHPGKGKVVELDLSARQRVFEFNLQG